MTISKSVAAFSIFAAILAAPHTAFAGGSSSCHFHGSTPAPEKTLLECATKRIEMLASKGKVDAMWKSKSHESIEVVEVKKGKEWKITYADPDAKDAKKAKLYLFFSHSGNFIAANHTGQ